MKKSDIEKQLKKDLSAAALSDFGAVWEKCVTPETDGNKQLVAEPVAVTARGASANSSPSRKIISIAAVAFALLLCVAVILCVTLIKPQTGGYFVIDVNPSVRVDYDGGAVTAAKGLNRDGEELLSGLELEGLTYDKAAEAIFDACEAKGYFSAEREDNAILLTASKKTGEKDEKTTAELNRKFTQKFQNKNMKGVVISDVDNTKWQKEAEKYGINGQKYELIMRYLESGGKLDEAEYATVSIYSLYSLINGSDKGDKDKTN